MTMQIREPVLLTGAGFTRNFGGFLATQMWAEIFNHEQVQLYPSLVNLLKDNFDFESVYNEVMDGNSFPPEARAALQQAGMRAYNQLDDATRNYWGRSFDSRPLVNLHGFRKLLEHFGSEGKARGYIFTLNQDLFVERWHSEDQKLLRISSMTPGVDFRGITPWSLLCGGELTPEYYFQAPSNPTEVSEDISKILYYVKLHGSMNWKSSDGRDLMVIGGNKPAQIHREKLLQGYFDLFQKVLSCPNRRLLVIGYGFRDLHINAVIAQSIRQHGLKLYIISPQSPEGFKNELLRDSDENKKTLWQGLRGYWNRELKDVCPANQSHFAEDIRRTISPQ
jgi:SIR2-like protein